MRAQLCPTGFLCIFTCLAENSWRDTSQLSHTFNKTIAENKFEQNRKNFSHFVQSWSSVRPVANICST